MIQRSIHFNRVAGTILVMSCLLISGCGSDSDGRQNGEFSGTIPEEPLPLPSVEHDASDPYDAFLSDELFMINSARVELIYNCYASNGYPQFLEVLPEQKANGFRNRPTTPDFRTTFDSFSALPWYPNEEYARAAGFGHPYPGMDSRVMVDDGAFPQVAAQCEEEALTVMAGSAELLQAYTVLGNNLGEAVSAAADQNRAQLNEKIFACMSEGDYPVDPDGPNKEPIWGVDFGVPLGAPPEQIWPDVSKGGSVQIVPAVPDGRYVPTVEESNAAAAMHKCSVETGARDSWIEEINEVKEQALERNENALTELNPQIEELAKSAAIAVQNQLG